MEKEKFIYYLEHPSLIDQSDIEQLEDMAKKYPFFQLAHTILAKYAHEKEGFLALQKIRTAAVHLYDRSALRNFILTDWEKAEGKVFPQEKTISRDLLTEEPLKPTPSTTTITRDLVAEEKSFFEELDVENTNSTPPPNDISYEKIWDIVDKPSTTTSSQTEEVSESKAMDLFGEGKTEEAIAMYKTLMRQNPGRKSYYQRQLAILTDDESYMRDEDEKEVKLSIIEPITDQEKDLEVTIPPPLTDIAKGQEGQVKLNQNTEKSIEQVQTNYVAKFDLNQTNDVANKQESQYLSSFFDDIEEENPVLHKNDTILYEDDAVLYFNQGNTEAAIGVYEKLIKQHPEQREHFLRQIQVLKSFEKKDEEANSTENAIDTYFEKIEPAPSPDMNEQLTEADALMLYNEGRLDEAMEIYEKLILLNPSKKTYYLTQMEILRS